MHGVDVNGKLCVENDDVRCIHALIHNTSFFFLLNEKTIQQLKNNNHNFDIWFSCSHRLFAQIVCTFKVKSQLYTGGDINTRKYFSESTGCWHSIHTAQKWI